MDVSTRLRNLGVAAVVGVLLASFGSSLLAPDQELSPTPVQPLPPAAGKELLASPTHSPAPQPDGIGTSTTASASPSSGLGTTTREYAIALSELKGLPVDAAPGARLDVWVTWHPPVTNKPTVQRLIQGAVLERIVPALTPEGSDAVLLSVDRSRLSALIFGDRFGELSVAMLPMNSAARR